MVKKQVDASPVTQGKRTDLQQLATHLGLSKTTVSFVLNDAPQAQQLSAETRKRVLEAAKKLNYRPSYYARNLRKGSSESIGVIVPEMSEGYFTLVMGGVEEYLLEKHFLYFTTCHYWRPELMKDYPRMLQDRGVEGLLVLNTNVEFESHLPTVAVSGHKTGPLVTNVTLDHVASAQLAIQHLYELGHRRIAFMKGQQYSVDSKFRWKAILDVARDFGLKVPPELTIELQANSWSPELGYFPVKAFITRKQEFSAMFCFNDTAAIGAMRALGEAGLRIPEDVSVIGFDDIMSAAYQRPSLTTIRQPLRAMGTIAARTLLEKIIHPEERFPEEIVMGPELVVRESSGKAKARERTKA
ncbi:Maltose operon transcriptional repressor MalR, LacI family [Acidisarcina polymorpha]|uniref:Maltose operon transcriptional repressor MalR, LacI family n=1 Tax=Acidisarcina polymorpha TaxID=2211140 RepID=A0A2Z5FVA7_9BACT|nr:LacI family DNA-binding transcriptional regulator [Acidisarcina polymorpha]AXC10798.1 Maltose operon transcriptional repressor MalR, LacI family [Acidisarcina polymorpha]